MSVRPQMVDFGSEQGLSNLETGGIAGYFEDSAKASLRAPKSENAALGRKMPFVDGHELTTGIDNGNFIRFLRKTDRSTKIYRCPGCAGLSGTDSEVVAW